MTNIDRHGLWLYVAAREYFLPYEQFPWFRDARVSDVLRVEVPHEGHLRWPALDVDLCVEALEDPERFPLVYDAG